MSGNVNKVILIGNLGRDPEIRYTQNGDPVANFSIATNEKWKDKNTKELQEKTEWHFIVAFGKTAETIREYLKKGSKCYIEGKLETSKYTDKEGIERYSTKVIVKQIQLLDSGKGHQGTNAPVASENYAQVKSGEYRASIAAQSKNGELIDDIPF